MVVNLENHIEGSTEPWVQDLLVALLKALQRPSPAVLETGSYLGHTSVRLLHALQEIGRGSLTVAEWDPEAPERADQTQARLEQAGGSIPWHVVRSDALAVIRDSPDDSLDFVFLDDNHQHEHVAAELEALMPKIRAGGLITGHDQYGICQLHEEFAKYPNSISLDLPALGPAGGLGIIQCR